MKLSEITFTCLNEKCWFNTNKYHYGDNLRVDINFNEGPMACLSVNVAESNILPNEFICKNYSENKLVVKDAFDTGIFINTGKTFNVGHVTCPIWAFKPDIELNQ